MTISQLYGLNSDPTMLLQNDRWPPTTRASIAVAADGGRTATLSAVDGMTGVAATYYKFDGAAAYTRYSGPFALDPSAHHSLTYYSVDNAGNAETPTTMTDIRPPVTTASGAQAGAWYGAPVTITLSAVDNPGGSGVASTEYRLDAGAWTAGTSVVVPAPADHSGDGVHIVSYRSSDLAGNVEAVKTCQVQIDTTPPTGSFAVDGGAASTTKAAVTLDSAVSDLHLATMRFRDQGGLWTAWEPYAATRAWSLPWGDGAKTVEAEYRDAAGNLLDLADSIELQTGIVDVIAPVTTAAGYDAAWHNASVTITLSAVDDAGGSGVARTEYSLDGGAWTAGTSVLVAAPADHSGDKVHTVSYRSRDAAGNVEAVKSCKVRIDTRRPTPEAPYRAYARRGGTAILKYRVTDPIPNGGTAKVTIRIWNRAGKLVRTLPAAVKRVNTKGALTATFRVPLTWKAGTYTFYVRATDAAGNSQLRVARNTLVVR